MPDPSGVLSGRSHGHALCMCTPARYQSRVITEHSGSPQSQNPILASELLQPDHSTQRSRTAKVTLQPEAGPPHSQGPPQTRRELRVSYSVILCTLHRPIIRTTNNSDGVSATSVTCLFLIFCKWYGIVPNHPENSR